MLLCPKNPQPSCSCSKLLLGMEGEWTDEGQCTDTKFPDFGDEFDGIMLMELKTEL